MESLGKQLQKHRESKGINLKDISLQTKIGLRHLEAIENDRLDLLPGGFFTRQILKTYLINIGLNPQEWLKKYMAAGLLETEELQIPSKKKSQKEKSEVLHKLFSGLLLLAIILATITLALISIKSSKKTAENLKKQVASQVVVEEKEKEKSSAPSVNAELQTEQVQKTETELTGSQEYQGLNMELNFTEECWIQVYADGHLVVDGLKLDGYRTAVKAENEILINIGNAGALNFRLNGKPGKPLGKRGAVIKNIRITPDNIQQFLAEAETQ